MSIARVKTSAFAARKGATLRCQRCQREIAKGEVYRWWFVGFRSRYKRVRCMTCPAPRTSELESSRLSEAYAAVETAEDALDAVEAPGDEGDLESILQDAASEIQSLADDYRSADEQFGGGGGTDSGQRADDLEQAAQDLEGWDAEEFDNDGHWCSEHSDEEGWKPEDLITERESCTDCREGLETARQEWWDEQTDSARSALSDLSF